MTEEKQVYDLKELFEAVQLKNILHDGKTFPDCIPKFSLNEIEQKYLIEKDLPAFELKLFVENNFAYPVTPQEQFTSDTNRPIEEHIELLWGILTRHPDKAEKAGSLINLPFPYIVPGGRFREIYYWDSYFTMLGLLEHGHVEMIENMVNNFAYLIHKVGHIPNGNRTYYLTRSQPPYFAMMVELLAKAKNDESVYITYLDALQKEYDFWQLGENEIAIANHHTIKMADGAILNRYFDESATPRQESYAEDFHLSQSVNQSPENLCTNIRAGAESGWDFSSRWFADFQHIETIETTNIIPVDLNCLVYKLENVLAKAYELTGEIDKSKALKTSAGKRWKAILKYCWNDAIGFFTDYNWQKKSIINNISAAGLMPLFIGNEQDEFIYSKIKTITQTTKDKLLKGGGIVTTPITSGQQWDAPNGWAPLQWIAAKGLNNFGEKELAKTIAQRWVSLNEKVYANTGKMMEKYDVVDLGKLAGGGEYESQDGFGWSNGVYLAMKSFLKDNLNRLWPL